MQNQVTYAPKIVETICQRMANGETLTAICRDDGMPSRIAFYQWAEKYPEVALQFAHARDKGFDAMAEQAELVAKGIENYSTNDVQRDKLVVETTLKLLAKWSKRYSDKTHIELTGKDGAPLSMRLIEAQQRLLKDITPQAPQMAILEHKPALDDII
jgi:hypothetical protein